MSRLYREGRHHAFAASLLSRGLVQEMALHAGLPPHASAPRVAEGLRTRGSEDLAHELSALTRAAEGVSSERELHHLATRAAALRQRLPSPGVPPRVPSPPEET